MGKNKSVFVTIIVTLLMAALAVAAYLLFMKAFVIIAVVFSVIGFCSSMTAFCKWLEKPPRGQEAIDPPEVAPYAGSFDDDGVRLWGA